MQWKLYRLRKMQDAIINHKQYSATQMLQKYLKGYKVAKQFNDVYIKMRLNNNFDYFDMLKSKICADAQIKIAYYVRKYLKKLIKKKVIKNNSKLNSQVHNISKVKPYIDGKQKYV